ncbi:MAG: RdgB/HAM1 family non-canonical purine NTP pyrophosphatase [Breznakibacter sp.]|nr:RdgB/HAM1 family non-canonical purine NTP pyrophosphatase [Breznakibacter sp.]
MKSLIIATHNKNKTIEFIQMGGDVFNISDLHDIGCEGEIPETGATLEENALQKASFVHLNYGVNCLADDTGLEINALDGAPGVYSARFAGEEKSSVNNIQKVLELMRGHTDRRASFRTVIALIVDGEEYLFEGVVEGEILEHPQGTGGFGYDAIFKPVGYDHSFAEMALSDKNKISHRRRAFDKFVQFVNNQYRHV